ncbi:PREDICTED: elongation of very long chain fatty acids protein AAEL008004-like [Vollenhovia emeryi]|uniref:elongation of very long chain fatty acids protein AAEL008004-like n=1 Tax=Vollenhovia emeryi TaxID=411798 RepID=UPI0005F3B10A|nr:PREDICTED: elongation of very long chain fatty acids protein AAEL008004-like [Vollenhovia emeryi]
MVFVEIYNHLFVELSYSQTREWLFLSSPLPLLLITLAYLYFIYYAGPRYMKNRPPYKLRTVILIYDLIQILINLWSVKVHMSAGWSSALGEIRINSDCGKRYAAVLDANRLFEASWWLIWIKLFDYIETCLFVLRKKQNQVSVLHVYHHISNVVTYWYYLKYVLDVRSTYIQWVNGSVHVVMYIHYFLSAWSPNVQRMVSSFKPILTIIQMVQFILLLLPVLVAIWYNCKFQTAMVAFFVVNMIIFLYLFYDFYKKTYTPKKKSN